MKKNILIGCIVTLLVCFFSLITTTTGCSPGISGSDSDYKPRYAAPVVNSPMIVSYNDVAKEAGYRIINSGGNAFDAYVAVTVVENVVSYGYVTLAGLLSTLMYHADTNKITYLDGGFNSVLDPQGAYDPQNLVIGKTIVVPGLVAGLEAIQTRYGRLSFAEVLQPAIELARDGFPISEYYSLYIEYFAEKLRQTEYGRRTFFPNDTALQPGDILRQPELAEFPCI